MVRLHRILDLIGGVEYPRSRFCKRSLGFPNRLDAQKASARILAAIFGLLTLLQPPLQVEASCSAANSVLIRVELLQEGIAGRTGERTTIGDDGCFSADRLLNGKVISHLRSGQLGVDRMRSVRAAIEEAGLASLPDRMGIPPTVNPAFVIVSYRGAVKTIAAPPGAGPKEIEALAKGQSGEPSARLARLVARLLELTGS